MSVMELSRIKKLLTETRYDEKFANEEDYLSAETLSRRRDKKLVDHITSTLYRLELENVQPSFDVKLKTGLHRRPYAWRVHRRQEETPPPVAVSTSFAVDNNPSSSARQFDGYATIEPENTAAISKRRQAVATAIERSGSVAPDNVGTAPATTRLRERSVQPQQQRHSMYETLEETSPTSDTYYRLLHLQSAIGNYAALPRNWRQEFDHIAYRIANQADDTYEVPPTAELASTAARMRASIQQQQQQASYGSGGGRAGGSWTKWRTESSSSALERPYEDAWTARQRERAELSELMSYMTPASTSKNERLFDDGGAGQTNGYDDVDAGDVEELFQNPFGARKQNTEWRLSHQSGRSTANEYDDLIKRLHL